MFIRFLLFFIFIPFVGNSQQFLSIYGNIQPRVSDTVYLYAYNSTFSHLKGKALVHKAKLDENGNYYIKLLWEVGAEINLLNGDNYIVYNIFLNPNDSIGLNYNNGRLTVEGKGSENVEYFYEFADKFFRDSTTRVEYNDAFGNKGLKDFNGYIKDRRDEQLNFLNAFYQQKKTLKKFL